MLVACRVFPGRSFQCGCLNRRGWCSLRGFFLLLIWPAAFLVTAAGVRFGSCLWVLWFFFFFGSGGSSFLGWWFLFFFFGSFFLFFSGCLSVCAPLQERPA